MTWHSSLSLANNFIHRSCGEKGCLKFEHEAIVFPYQRLALPPVALLTLLSTEFVYFGEKVPGMHREDGMRNFYARQEHPYVSSTFPLKHSLANNLINRICEEVHRWRNSGKVAMRIFCA